MPCPLLFHGNQRCIVSWTKACNIRMTDVSRLSTFPPILRSYNSGIFTSSQPFRPLHAAKSSKNGTDQEVYGGRQHIVQVPTAGSPDKELRGAAGGRKLGGGGVSRQPASNSGLLSSDTIRREQELELRRKRNKESHVSIGAGKTFSPRYSEYAY